MIKLIDMYIGVVGGRTRNDTAFIETVLERFIKPEDVIVSGGAKGVDTIARRYARKNKIELIECLPDDMEESPDFSAFKERNKKIASISDVIIAFPSKKSRGTWHTIQEARNMYKRIIIYEER